MNLKFFNMENRADKSVYLKLVDEDDNSDPFRIVELNTDQLLLIIHKAAGIIWLNFDLVPRK